MRRMIVVKFLAILLLAGCSVSVVDDRESAGESLVGNEASVREASAEVKSLIAYVEEHRLDFLEEDWDEVDTRLESIEGLLDEDTGGVTAVPPRKALDQSETFTRNIPLDDPPSESYALREIQTNLARDIISMWVTMSQPIFANANAINDGIPFNGGCKPNPYSWETQRMRVNFGPETDHNCVAVTFVKVVYTDDTDLTYSNPRVVEGPLGNLPGSESDRRINNRDGSRTGEELEIEQSFTIEQSVESKSATDFSVDVTVESTTKVTVGGDEVGGSFEEELKTTFGSHFGQSEEETKAQSTAQTDSVKAAFTVSDGQDILAVFSNKPITTKVDYSVNGYYDFGIVLTLNHYGDTWWNNTRYNGGRWGSEISDAYWYELSRNNYFNRCFATNDNPGWRNRSIGSGGPTHWGEFHFDSLQDFLDMFEGTNVDWPRLGDDDCSIERGITDYEGMWPHIADWIKLTEDKHRRKIVLKGNQTRDSESAVRLTFYDLSKCSEDDADNAEDNAEDPTKAADQVLVGVNGNSLSSCVHDRGSHDATRTPVSDKGTGD